MASTELSPRELVAELFRAAIAAVLPESAVVAALERAPVSTRPVRLLAFGKAAPRMARAAAAWLEARRVPLAGGLVVGTESQEPIPPLTWLAGDHPEPAARSARAAEFVARAALPDPGDQALVLISGGASSLIAAPVDPVSPDALRQLFHLLLSSGLDISAVNTVRKRFLRWGAGRLALALYPMPCRVLILSDVIGDDPGTIGSGPMSPDPATAHRVLSLLRDAGLLERLEPTIRGSLRAVEAGQAAETPKPGDRCFDKVSVEIIGSNRLAVAAAEGRARTLGWRTTAMPEPLEGEASLVGSRIGQQIAAADHSGRWCSVWGGETTVTLGERSGLGGRCQDLALAAAQELRGCADIALLAAGTDGRDGPTDAAGALVDGGSWQRSLARGIDPAAALAEHDSYHALDAAGDLLRTGPTGTNVMDLVIAAGAPG